MRTILFSLFSLMVFSSSLESRAVHAILVIDSLSLDIRESLLIDRNRMVLEVKRVAALTGGSLFYSLLEGKNANSQTVLEAIDLLDVQENDLLLFYFTGHGFRDSLTETALPNLGFSREDSFDFLPMDHLLAILREKRSALLIVLIDSCNSLREEGERVESLLPKSSSLTDRVRRGYRHLFLRSEGEILACGSLPYHPSYCFANRGGLFTSTLLDVIHEKASNKSVHWLPIFEEVGRRVQKWQTPYFEIDLDISP